MFIDSHFGLLCLYPTLYNILHHLPLGRLQIVITQRQPLYMHNAIVVTESVRQLKGHLRLLHECTGLKIDWGCPIVIPPVYLCHWLLLFLLYLELCLLCVSGMGGGGGGRGRESITKKLGERCFHFAPPGR